MRRIALVVLAMLALSFPAIAAEWSSSRLGPHPAAVFAGYTQKSTLEWSNTTDPTIPLDATSCGTVTFGYLDDVVGTDTAAAASVYACENGDTTLTDCTVLVLTLTADAPFLPVRDRRGFFHVDITAAPGSGTAQLTAYCSESVAHVDPSGLGLPAASTLSGTATGGGATSLVDSGASFINAGVQIGDKVVNTTDAAAGWVTNVAATTLTISALSNSAAFAAAEGYTVHYGGVRPESRIGSRRAHGLYAQDNSPVTATCYDRIGNAWGICDPKIARQVFAAEKRTWVDSVYLQVVTAVDANESADAYLELWHGAHANGSVVKKIGDWGGPGVRAVGATMFASMGFMLEPGDNYSIRWVTDAEGDCATPACSIADSILIGEIRIVELQ